jgi:E3 ubiquitin-protein ligase HOS1
MDVQRLHSLFDVAVQNNLTSLICHCILFRRLLMHFYISISHLLSVVFLIFWSDITDVCLDENAVSSDPLLAFLLDEVVIKDWCKRAVNALISEIGVICIQKCSIDSRFSYMLYIYIFLLCFAFHAFRATHIEGVLLQIC